MMQLFAFVFSGLVFLVCLLIAGGIGYLWGAVKTEQEYQPKLGEKIARRHNVKN